jgi:asparagine synthase (glutamine-hydrolysing)
MLAIFRPGGIDDIEPSRLLALLAHRGPDAAATWFSHDRQVALGHRRLKIVAVSNDANEAILSSEEMEQKPAELVPDMCAAR